VGKYGFSMGAGLDLKNAKLGIGYQFDSENELKDRHTISASFGIRL